MSSICIDDTLPEQGSGLNPAVLLRSAQHRWASQSTAFRLAILKKFRDLLVEQALELAKASARLRRRPVAETLVSEVLPLVEACRFLERKATSLLIPKRLNAWTRPLWLMGVSSEIRREPHGIVLIIGPGNYPLFLPGVQLLQALAAGNAVLLKPAPGCSEPARRLISLMARAGLDSRLATLLPESTEAAREALGGDIDKVVFTGAAATGKKILSNLAPRLVPAVLELSGCDAVIVRADADLELVTRALLFGLRLNGGETCIAPRRVFVARRIAAELEERLARALEGENSGRGLPEKMRSDRLLFLLEDALARGAHLVTGEKGKWPIILATVPPDALLLHEDVFAPVLSLVTVEDDEESVAGANQCPYALGASIFTRNQVAARRIATRLKAGTVTINDLIVPTADSRLPFGGRGRSGYGTTRGAEGLLEMTVAKVVTVSKGRFRPAYDQPTPGDEHLCQAYLGLSHASGWKRRLLGLCQLIGLLWSRQTRLKSYEKIHE